MVLFPVGDDLNVVMLYLTPHPDIERLIEAEQVLVLPLGSQAVDEESSENKAVDPNESVGTELTRNSSVCCPEPA